MARKPASELMVIKSIYGPARLLNIPNLSETVVGLLESNSTSSAPIDPRFASIQSKIFEYIQEDPALPQKYSRNEEAVERIVIARLLIDKLEATASDISAAMVAAERVRA